MKAKNIILAVTLVLFLTSVPLGVFLFHQRQEIRLRAAPNSTIFFKPANLTVAVGESFTLAVIVQTEANLVSKAELEIVFNPLVFKVVGLIPGADLSMTLGGPTLDNDGGRVSIIVGDEQNPIEGSGEVALVSFETLASSAEAEEIDFGPETQVSVWDEEGENLLTDTTSALVSILNNEATLEAGGAELASTEEGTAPTPTGEPAPTTPTGEPMSTPIPTLAPVVEGSPVATEASTPPELLVSGNNGPTMIVLLSGLAFFIFGFLRFI